MKANLNIYLPTGKIIIPVEVDDEIFAQCEDEEDQMEYLKEVCDEMTLALLERNVTLAEKPPAS